MLNPNLSFHEVESLARKAETNWLKIKLPAEIKAEFASVWDASIGYPAIPSDGQIKLYTSDTNCENVVDSDLAKAIAAGNYRAHLHALRDAIKELAGQNNYSSTILGFSILGLRGATLVAEPSVSLKVSTLLYSSIILP